MQQEKFKRASECIDGSMEESQSLNASTSTQILSPVNLRKGSAAYWKAKFEALNSAVDDLSSTSQDISRDEIPGFLHINKVKPKENKDKAVRVTQVCEFMQLWLRICENTKSTEFSISINKWFLYFT